MKLIKWKAAKNANSGSKTEVLLQLLLKRDSRYRSEPLFLIFRHNFQREYQSLVISLNFTKISNLRQSFRRSNSVNFVFHQNLISSAPLLLLKFILNSDVLNRNLSWTNNHNPYQFGESRFEIKPKLCSFIVTCI